MEELATFDFSIIYYKGKKNPVNGLSRQSDHLDCSEVAMMNKEPLDDFLQ